MGLAGGPALISVTAWLYERVGEAGCRTQERSGCQGSRQSWVVDANGETGEAEAGRGRRWVGRKVQGADQDRYLAACLEWVLGRW